MDMEHQLLGRYFNSQPHEEADVDNMKWGNHVRNFNSQPHEEADILS